MKASSICFSLNYAPHYRKEIFLALEKDLKCDFYFGDRTFTKLKKIDYQEFEKPIRELTFKIFDRKFYYLKGQFALAFKAYSCYVLTGQMYNLSFWGTAIVNKLRGKRTYVWNHGWYGKENRSTRVLKRMQDRIVDGYFLYGEYAKRIMIDNGIDERKIHIVYNSLDYSKHLDLRKGLKQSKTFQEKFKNDYPTIIFVGRLTKIKKLDLLLDALQVGTKEGNNFNLVVIGDGEQRHNLEKKADTLNLTSNVWFYGACYDEGVIAQLFFEADMCVSPGNVGLTAIHSLSFGTPVITHDNFINQMPEFEAISPGQTGEFFKENDVSSLYSVIMNWIEEHPSKSEFVSQACFDIIDKYYNPGYQIRKFKEVLNACSSG